MEDVRGCRTVISNDQHLNGIIANNHYYRTIRDGDERWSWTIACKLVKRTEQRNFLDCLLPLWCRRRPSIVSPHLWGVCSIGAISVSWINGQCKFNKIPIGKIISPRRRLLEFVILMLLHWKTMIYPMINSQQAAESLLPPNPIRYVEADYAILQVSI